MDELKVDYSVVHFKYQLKVVEEVLLYECVHKCAVETLGVDGVLSNVADHLHHEVLVALCDYAHMTYGLLTVLLRQVSLRFRNVLYVLQKLPKQTQRINIISCSQNFQLT